MSFQILNKEGQAISITELDTEAAIFWGVPYHPKNYANPSKEEDFKNHTDYVFNQLGNWFDVIGYKIEHLEVHEGYPHYMSGWKAVIGGIMGDLSYRVMEQNSLEVLPYTATDDKVELGKAITINIIGMLEYAKPYIALIKHWADKGYTPKQVK